MFFRAGQVAVYIIVFTIPFQLLGDTLVVNRMFGSLTAIAGLIGAPVAALGLVYKKTLKKSYFLGVVVAFVCWVCASALWDSSPDIKIVIRYVQLLIFTCLVFEYSRNGQARYNMLAGFSLGCLFVGLLFAAKVFSGNVALTVHGFRMGDVPFNAIAYTLTLGCTVSLYCAYGALSSFSRVVFYFAAGVCVFGALMTGTRGAFALMILDVAFVLWIIKNGKMSTRVFGVFGVVVLVSVGASLISPEVYSRLFSVVGRLEDGQLTGRLDIWSNAIKLFSQHPFLGYGIGSFAETNYQYFGLNKAAHNVFLQLLVETGVVGGLLWCTLVLIAVYKSILKSCNEERVFWFLLWMQLLATFAVQNFATKKSVWFLIGLAAAANATYRIARTRGGNLHGGILDKHKTAQ